MDHAAPTPPETDLAVGTLTPPETDRRAAAPVHPDGAPPAHHLVATGDVAVLPRRLHLLGEAGNDPRLPDEVVRVGSDAVEPLPRTSPLPRATSLGPVPELAHLALPSVAWVVGRALITIAIAGAAHRVHVTATQGRAVTASPIELGVIALAALLGVVATVWWTSVVSVNTRRLGLSTPRLRTTVAAWLLPIAWIPAGTALMGVEVRAEVDPMPAVATIGLALSLAVPYLVAADLTRTLGRSRPLGAWWAAMWLVDLGAIGLAWYALVVHSSGSSWEAWPGTAAAVAAWASLVPFLVALVIATRVPRLSRLRLANLEHERAVAADPTWFRTGFSGRTTGRVAVRLRSTDSWRRAAAASFAVWTCAASLAAATASAPMWFAAPAPSSYVDGAGVLLLAAAGASTVAFAGWGTLAAANARRIRPVGAVTPTLPAVLGLPTPLALALAVAVGGDAGWTIAFVGVIAGGAASMVTLRALGSIAVSHRAPSVAFRAWALVMGLCVAASAGAFLTVGTTADAWPVLRVAHLFVFVHIAAIATMAALALRSMAALDSRLAEAAGTGVRVGETTR